jgi:hypothetical protein
VKGTCLDGRHEEADVHSDGDDTEESLRRPAADDTVQPLLQPAARSPTTARAHAPVTTVSPPVTTLCAMQLRYRCRDALVQTKPRKQPASSP